MTDEPACAPPTGVAAVGPEGAAALLGTLLDRPLTVVDAGARWGVDASWSWFGDAALVLAFEPDVEEADRLVAHYGDRTDVEIVPVALGARSGSVPFYITVDASGSSIFPPAHLPRFDTRIGASGDMPVDRVVQVDQVRLDEWLATSRRGPVDAIKLDVQGAELDILRGASSALSDVRMLIAEVHLNEMYEDAPLFGEVDGFLRQHGFEFWRFPVIAHMPQEPWRPAMVDRVDVHWFDPHPVAVPAMPGQAFWADALYVKRDFVNASSPADFDRLVRDAATAIGMHEPDLARMALRRARKCAPRGGRRTVEQALEALRYRSPQNEFRSSRLAHLELTAQVLSAPFDVDLTLGDLGWGWHDPAPGEGGGWIRWTGPQREASMELPLTLPPGTEVEVVATGAANPGLLATLLVEVNGETFVPAASADGRAVTYRVTTSERGWTRGYTRVVIRTGPTVPWAEMTPGSDDWTDYGVAVAAVRLTPPSGRAVPADG